MTEFFKLGREKFIRERDGYISMRVCALSTLCNFERPTLWSKLEMPWTQSHFDSSRMQKNSKLDF